MNTIKNKKIAIVGGGPGGLTLAKLLQIKGADVKVYERDAHRNARQQGATLDLHEESGLLALHKAGLMDEFSANYRPGAEKMRIVDMHGTIVLDDHLKTDDNISRPEIDRGPLQNILLDSLMPDTVVWDSHFASLEANGDGWNVVFQNGNIIYADIVIAADGANSKIRPYITDIKPEFAGLTVIEGIVYNSETTSPKIHALLKGGKIFAMGDEKTIIVSSKGDGSLVFYAGFKTDEQWSRKNGIDFSDKAQAISWFKEHYATWDTVWLELLENAKYPLTLRPQYCIPLTQTWEAQPNLTLLGDAAHLMPPYAGEGVNMAMLDALELSHCLTNEDFADTQSAIASYEKHMRARAAETAYMTMQSTEMLHSPGAIMFMVDVVG